MSQFFRKIFSCPSQMRFGTNQAGFSLIEILMSVGLLGVAFLAYTKFYVNTMGLSQNMSEKTDLLMIRQFIQSQFSCERTLEKSSQRVNGRLVNVRCPSGTIGHPVDILNSDGAVMFPELDDAKKLDKKNNVKNGGLIGGYRVVGLCDGNGSVPDPASPISIPTFRFFASKESNDLTFNRGPLGHPGWYDVFDGNEIQCALPDDAGIPMDLKCTAMFVSDPGGVVTGEVPGPFFRSNGSDRGVFRDARLAELVVRSQRDLDAPSEGRIANWKMKWMNKNPEATIATLATGRKKVVDGTVQPVASDEFTVPGNQVLSTVGLPPDQCARNSEVTETIPVLNQNPGCSYWEQKVSFTQMKNPSDWYAAPMDLLITGVDAAGKKITECATKLQIVSPLVLIWPKSVEDSHDLDFYPTATKFDLTAKGRPVTTGWINGSSAFLVLDRNKNGKIDNGAELFGDASAPREEKGPRSTKSFANGFEALAEYDDNHDRVIDARDPVYDELRLWFDENSDGQSQPWEIHKLVTFEVERIGLGYKRVDKQPTGANVLTNFVYEAAFHGPGVCGSEGCRIYDIYFATAYPTTAY